MFNRIKSCFPPPIPLCRLLPVAGLVLFLAGRISAQSGCSCTNCPQALPDNFEGNFFIQVQNAANPVLGQNGQGVCGVTLHFDHEFVGDLLITLTSPAGQTVTLVGQTGFFGETDGTEWEVTFVPCNTPADPDPGFSPIWDNDQPWGVFGNYNGSYFPNTGCLQDFNVGPVNGQWTLNVLDALPNDAGNFYDYQIIFCDPTGIECFTCEADAGNLLQPDTSFCAGDTALLLDLQPFYPNLPPPAGAYAYTYVISAAGVITGYESLPDLSAYSPGAYTVCGLSYLGGDANKIPPPDGILTLAELTAMLNSSSPPFCGDITTNCVNIDIVSPPGNISDTAVICAPDCYVFFDTAFCESGVYTIQLLENNCLYTATLFLTVLQPATADVYETICAGACAQSPGFGQYCESGDYVVAFPGANGCDSLVTLHLTVLDPEASVAPPQALSCSQTEVVLSGVGSTLAGPGVTYQWTAQSGGNLTGPADQVDVKVTAPGYYQLVVCLAGGTTICCDTASAMVVANQNPPSPPLSIIGPDRVCSGQNIDFQAEVSQYASTYNWVLPSGIILNAGQGTQKVNVNWANNAGGNVCVTAENACGASTPVCLPVETTSAPSAPVVGGPDTLCAGSLGWFTANHVSADSGYVWEVTGGSILNNADSAAIQVRWNDTSGSGVVCARALNQCGPGEQFCRTVTLIVTPEIQAGADTAACGPALVLPGYADTAVYWDILSGPGTATFRDTVDSRVFVAVSLPGSYRFRRVRQNGVCMNADTMQAVFSPLPEIGQPAYACDAVNENYTASLPISGGVAPYLANGFPLTGNLFISSSLPNGIPFTVQVSDAMGCSVSRTDSFSCPCVSFAGFMNTQLLQVCEGETVTAQHLGGQFLDANDTALFVLHTASGDSLGQIIDQNTSGEFGLQPGMDFGATYYISYVVGNSDSSGYPDLNDPCLSVVPGQPVVFYANPEVHAGADTAVCGNSILLNAVPPNGQWIGTSSGPSNALKFDDFQNPQTAVYATQPGKYTLKWLATENGCPGSDEIVIQFYDKPGVSDTVFTCEPDNENYTVQFKIIGGTPPFSVNGILLANDYFQSSALSSGQIFQFSITDSNGCMTPEISGDHTCDCITDAGTMHQDTLIVCGTDTVQFISNGDYQLDNNDITDYVLHTDSGPTLGQILARNQTGNFTFVPGIQFGKLYYVSLIAGNVKNGLPDPGGPCFSVAAGQPAVFLEQPQPYTTPDQTVCGQTTEIDITGSLFPGSWSFLSGPGNVDFASEDSVRTAAAVSEPGLYFFRWTEMNDQCMATADVAVTFFDQPAVQNLKESCNGANTAFSVSFDLVGGTPPFKVDGLNGLLNGPFFLSLPLLNQAQYAFTVTDANDCATPPVSGSKYCACETYAGSMSATPATFCAGEPAAVVWNNDAVTDDDDIVQFILHDNPGASPGNILKRSDQPVFPYDAAFSPGVTYYISAIAGNNSGAGVDLQDPCFSIVPGTPVQWRPAPAVLLAADSLICSGQNAVLRFTGSGIFPLTIAIKDDQGGTYNLSLPDQQPGDLVVSPVSTTAYTLVQVADSGFPSCSTLYNLSVMVLVNQQPDAGAVIAEPALCENEPQTIYLPDLLSGAQSGGLWKETSDFPSTPGAFNAHDAIFNTQGQHPGVYRFQYLAPGLPPCFNDSVVASIRILPAPVADAGPDVLLDCEQPVVLLGGPATTTGAGISYQWLRNGIPATVGDAPVLQADTAGIFTLRVLNQYECSANDDVRVGYAAPPISIRLLRVLPVRCFGEDNGAILLDSLDGGTPPYRFSLGDAPFGHKRFFTNLTPGEYLLRVQDAAGCEWVSLPLMVSEPPEIKIDLGGPFEAALGDSLYLSIETTHQAGQLDTIIWTPLMDSSAAGKPFQRFFPLRSGKIRVEMRDSNGCKQADETVWLVNRERRVYFPNAFKPGDGTNNVFYISGGNDVEEVEIFQIFDRWGGLVFEMSHFQPNDPANGWTGDQRGSEALPGVFTFFAAVRFRDGEKETFTGNVTLLR